VDIETDSTIQAMDGADQTAISALLTGIGGFVQAVAPAVQGGIIPAEAAKALLSSIVRKFKLGREVDDAFGEEAQEQGMPPQVQQAMRQVQEQAQQVQQGMDEVEQGKKDLEHQKQLNELKNANDRLKLEHATEIHRMATEQRQDETVNAVRSMLDDHMNAVQQRIASVTNAGL
jgi:vacuolar-type H+-ATPase subunit I/STV1